MVLGEGNRWVKTAINKLSSERPKQYILRKQVQRSSSVIRVVFQKTVGKL